MRHVRRYYENFAGSNRSGLSTIEIKLQRARQNHCVLLAAGGNGEERGRRGKAGTRARVPSSPLTICREMISLNLSVLTFSQGVAAGIVRTSSLED